MSQETIGEMNPDGEVNPILEQEVELTPGDSVNDFVRESEGDLSTAYRLADELLAVVAQSNRKLTNMRREALAAENQIAELTTSAKLLLAQAGQLNAENRLRVAEINLIRTDIRIARTNLANAQRENS